MKRIQSRHYPEEELLMHHLQEETRQAGEQISAHLLECTECRAVFEEYVDLVVQIRGWTVPEIPQTAWEAQRAIVLARYRTENADLQRKGMMQALQQSLVTVWNYALNNPLPTLAYIAVAVAFALERTISTFRLERLLPGSGELFEILRQIL